MFELNPIEEALAASLVNEPAKLPVKEMHDPIYLRAVDGRKLGCFYTGKCALSNFYLSEFEVDGVKFTSMEQYIQYKKAEEFKDFALAKQILKEGHNDPMAANLLGESVKDFSNTHWRLFCADFMIEGLKAKFTASKLLKDFLIETGDAILVECNPSETLWSCGVPISEWALLCNPGKWPGSNLLGIGLMELREELKEQKE